MKYILAILAVLLLASCALKKRTYRDGYYIDWAFHKKVKAPVKEKELPQSEIVFKQELNNVVIVSSTSNPQTQDVLVNTKTKRIHLEDSCGDIITMRSGDQVKARVMEITEDKIKYKRCDNLEGPQFVVSKANVLSITYSNGVVEKIEAPLVYNAPGNNGNPNVQSIYNTPKKIHPKAWWALCSVLFLFWLFGLGIILGLIFASSAIKEIKSNPNKWTGMGLAKTVQIICIIFLSLILLAIILSL